VTDCGKNSTKLANWQAGRAVIGWSSGMPDLNCRPFAPSEFWQQAEHRQRIQIISGYSEAIIRLDWRRIRLAPVSVELMLQAGLGIRGSTHRVHRYLEFPVTKCAGGNRRGHTEPLDHSKIALFRSVVFLCHRLEAYSPAFAANVSTTAIFCSNSGGRLCHSCK